MPSLLPRRPVTGWKAALVVIAALFVVFGLLNWIGARYRPEPARPVPSPTVIR